MTSIAVDDRRDGPDDRRDLVREKPGRRVTDRQRMAKWPCPHCQHRLSRVISDWDYRPNFDEDEASLTRYRRCDACRRIFWTEEKIGGAC